MTDLYELGKVGSGKTPLDPQFGASMIELIDLIELKGFELCACKSSTNLKFREFTNTGCATIFWVRANPQLTHGLRIHRLFS